MSTLGLGPPVYVRKETNASQLLKVPFTKAYGFQTLQGDDDLTYQPSTGTLKATRFDGIVAGDITGNAATATRLQTSRNIGGVAFDGTADIDLPGVNIAGNQDTSGNAATATELQTSRNIGGVAFNGTADIDLPGVNIAGNQDTSGTATTALRATNTDSLKLQLNNIGTSDYAMIWSTQTVYPDDSDCFTTTNLTFRPDTCTLNAEAYRLLDTTIGVGVDRKYTLIETDNGTYAIAFVNDALAISSRPFEITRQTVKPLEAEAFHLNANSFKYRSSDGSSNLFTVQDLTIASNITESYLINEDQQIKCTCYYHPVHGQESSIQSQLVSTGVGQSLRLNPEGGQIKFGEPGVNEMILKSDGTVVIHDGYLAVKPGILSPTVFGLRVGITGLACARFEGTINVGSDINPNKYAEGIQSSEVAGLGQTAYIRALNWVKVFGYLSGTNTFAICDFNMAGTGVSLAAGGTSWGITSDERVKIIHGQLTNVLSTLDNIRCVRYNFKTDADLDPMQGKPLYTKQRIGFIAQDVLTDYPEAVEIAEDEEQPMRLAYQDMIPVTLAAVKELTVELKALKARVAELEGQQV